MKRSFLWLVLALCLLWPGTITQAQTFVTLDNVTIDLWPDYDRYELLVLITGILPEDTPLPATVEIPLPANADLLVVARITDEGNMIDDIEHAEDGDSITLTTPDRAFRVEYYLPYSESGNTRTIDFAWLAPALDVNQLAVQVQQPAYANLLAVDPSAITITERGDGLQYHVLPAVPVPAGQPYAVTSTYTLDPKLLSIDGLGNAVPDLGTSGGGTTIQPANESNWPLIAGIAGGAILLVVGTWFFATTRSGGTMRSGVVGNGRPRKPKPNRPIKTASNTPARFCHECGTGLQASDKFCKNCGTAVKK